MSRWTGPRIRATKTPQQYPYMQYPYQNVGTQLTWRNTPPPGSRGADSTSLGSYLPVPGGAEEIPISSGYSGLGCGCGCNGTGGCAPAPMSGVLDDPMAKAVAVAGAALLLYMALKKKRR